jgi:hypothetical protein
MSSASPAVPSRLVAVSGALSLLGFVGLLLTLILGFETPNTTLMVVSAPLMFAAPLAALWHFVTTSTLTASEKGIWTRALISGEAFSALAEYLRSADLRASTQRLVADAVARRTARDQT